MRAYPLNPQSGASELALLGTTAAKMGRRRSSAIPPLHSQIKPTGPLPPSSLSGNADADATAPMVHGILLLLMTATFAVTIKI